MFICSVVTTYKKNIYVNNKYKEKDVEILFKKQRKRKEKNNI